MLSKSLTSLTDYSFVCIAARLCDMGPSIQVSTKLLKERLFHIFQTAKKFSFAI